jgi:aromatic-L-amino-acid decarboxylase
MTNEGDDGATAARALQLSEHEMREFGYRAVDLVVDHFVRLDSKPVTGQAARGDLEVRLREALPREGIPPSSALDAVARDVLTAVMHLDHPRFFAFVPGPSNFVGVVVDLLASGFNVFAGTWLEASGPAEVELVTVDWLREVCGLPASAGGLMVSGGSHANLSALALARHVKVGGPDPRARVYVCDQTHSSVFRALRALGFTQEQVRVLASDDAYRLSVDVLAGALGADLAAGWRPMCVVATAGSTNTGAIDPLPAVADLCRDRNLWLHVDGAISSRARLDLAGLEFADSVSLDPHKWLFQPYELGCLLVREPRLLWDCYHVLPEYLDDAQPGAGEVNFCDYGLQLTRRFNALKLWMSLKVFGADAFADAVDLGIGLAEHAEHELRAAPHWEVITPAQLGVITFRYRPPETTWTPSALDELQRRIADRTVANGFAMVATTMLSGRRVLRLCTINPRTSRQDIERTLALLAAFGTEEATQAGPPADR